MATNLTQGQSDRPPRPPSDDVNRWQIVCSGMPPLPRAGATAPAPPGPPAPLARSRLASLAAPRHVAAPPADTSSSTSSLLRRHDAASASRVAAAARPAWGAAAAPQRSATATPVPAAGTRAATAPPKRAAATGAASAPAPPQLEPPPPAAPPSGAFDRNLTLLLASSMREARLLAGAGEAAMPASPGSCLRARQGSIAATHSPLPLYSLPPVPCHRSNGGGAQLDQGAAHGATTNGGQGAAVAVGAWAAVTTALPRLIASVP